jgi:mRNA-degrading endonuclease HigB of HigAB toxin-antitoxin module
MRVFSEKRIWDAKGKWPHAASALDQWYRMVKRVKPSDFAAMKSSFPATDKVGEFHVFDIGGNKLRLIAISTSSMCWITANMTAVIGRREEHERSDKKCGRALGVRIAIATQTQKRRRL